MTQWRPHTYESAAREAGVDPRTLTNAIATAEQITRVNANLAPVFTLRHLAHLTGGDYGLLRSIAERAPNEPYKVFRVRKRPAYSGEQRFRTITVPSPALMKTQRWIARAVLRKVRPHSASVAFSEGNTIKEAAEAHCKAQWLIKMDVQNFFESINEKSVFRVFRSLGYQPLMALELARVCTRLGNYSRLRGRWNGRSAHYSAIKAYEVAALGGRPVVGHLPQGAPTSPMLANLAMRDFDERVTRIARSFAVTYTRYADDLTFSTPAKDFGRKKCQAVIGAVYSEMRRVGLSPNVTKTRISAPGSRKVVLGLLVDGAEPRLPRDFRMLMRQHLHYLHRPDVGPVKHARQRGFVSIAGMRNHLIGLAAFARQIDEPYGDRCLDSLARVAWPV